MRAKRTLAEAHVPFEIPRGAEFTARLASVLQVIYLVFNEGYTATLGDDWLRPALCEDALRLGRVLAGLVPKEPEVHGLVALMEIQASRSRARVDAAGNRCCCWTRTGRSWDQLLIRRGLAALERAEQLGGSAGNYALQAAIAACHARANTGGRNRLAADRGALCSAGAGVAVAGGGTQSRGRHCDGARAVGWVGARGRARGISRRCETITCCPSVRGDLLQKLGRTEEARAEFERAAALTNNAREREWLLERARKK